MARTAPVQRGASAAHPHRRDRTESGRSRRQTRRPPPRHRARRGSSARSCAWSGCTDCADETPERRRMHARLHRQARGGAHWPTAASACRTHRKSRCRPARTRRRRAGCGYGHRRPPRASKDPRRTAPSRRQLPQRRRSGPAGRSDNRVHGRIRSWSDSKPCVARGVSVPASLFVAVRCRRWMKARRSLAGKEQLGWAVRSVSTSSRQTAWRGVLCAQQHHQPTIWRDVLTDCGTVGGMDGAIEPPGTG